MTVVTLDEFRKQIRARLTKGDAFSMTDGSYWDRQKEIETELAAMDEAAIRKKYVNICYGLKVKR